ncbi:MAG: PAAR domain-containing protein [Caulobacter sp.]|nr:PAAR domain-containing protein [Caulobacter sp.]
MGQPAAKLGDQIEAMDMHIVLIPEGPDLVPTPEELPFSGIIDNGVSETVMINGRPAATLGSTATNEPPHIPIGGAFQDPPTNQGEIVTGSATVMINGKPAARAGDTALTCNDPAPEPIGTVVAESTVMIGG